MATRNAFDAERNAVENGHFVRVGEETREYGLNLDGDWQTVGRESVARSEGVFDLHGRVAMNQDLAGEMKRGAFAIERILREAVENGEAHE